MCLCERLPTLDTERLRLRHLSYGDQAFLAMLDSSSLVMRYIHTGPLSCSSSLQWAAMQVECALLPGLLRTFGKWMVELRDRPVRIGWVEFGKLSRGRQDYVNLGYEFAPPFWGNGYATEANTRLIEYVFDETGCDCLLAYPKPANTRSHRLLNRLGFRRTGKSQLDEGRERCDLYKLTPRRWRRLQRVKGE